jgi:hypothetical protein
VGEPGRELSDRGQALGPAELVLHLGHMGQVLEDQDAPVGLPSGVAQERVRETQMESVARPVAEVELHPREGGPGLLRHG